MPLDTSMYSNISLPQAPLPSEALREKMTLANIGQRNVLNQQAIRENEMQMRSTLARQQEYEATLQRAARVREILATNPDPRAAIIAIRQIDPDAAMKVEKFYQDKEQKSFETRQKMRADYEKGIRTLLGEPNQSKWPNLYKTLRAGLTADRFYTETPEGKEFLASIPEEMPPIEEIEALARKDPTTAALLENIKERKMYGGRTAKEQDEYDIRKRQMEQTQQNIEATRNLTKAQQEETARYHRETIAARKAKGTAEGIARERFEHAKSQQRQTDVDAQTKEFRRLEQEEQIERGKAQEIHDMISAGGYMIGGRVLEPTDDQKPATLAAMRAQAARHENQANLLQKQKEQAYDKLASIGGATPRGKAPASQAPAAQPKPQAAAPKTYTEDEVRQRARAKGRDENAAVQLARSKGLIK